MDSILKFCQSCLYYFVKIESIAFKHILEFQDVSSITFSLIRNSTTSQIGRPTTLV